MYPCVGSNAPMEELTISAPRLRRCSQRPCLLEVPGNLMGNLQQPEGGVVHVSLARCIQIMDCGAMQARSYASTIDRSFKNTRLSDNWRHARSKTRRLESVFGTTVSASSLDNCQNDMWSTATSTPTLSKRHSLICARTSRDIVLGIRSVLVTRLRVKPISSKPFGGKGAESAEILQQTGMMV